MKQIRRGYTYASRMLAVRRVWFVLAGAWVGAFLGRALFEWLLDVEEPWRGIGILAVTAIALRRVPPARPGTPSP